MKKFIIDRKTWYRGEGSDDSRLLRSSDNKMCCLGQIALQCGFSKKEIVDIHSPSIAIKRYQSDKCDQDFKRLVDKDLFNSSLCCDLMIVNDDEDIEDREREFHLKHRFEKLDWEVEFVN